MKNTFLIFNIFLSQFLFAQGIRFEKSNFNELLAKAKKENKLLFIDAMASWCGPCKMMEKNIFPLKSVGELYNNNFINATIDMEKGEGREIAKKYAVQSYPTYLFINGDGQLVSKNMGYMNEFDFISLGKEAANAQKNFGSMRERFLKGEKDPQFLLNFLKLFSSSEPELAKQASERYFQNKKDKVFTKEEASYLLSYIKTVDDPNFKVFIENRPALAGHFPEEAYTQFENNLRMQKIIDGSINTDKKEINENYFLENASKLIGKDGAEQSLIRFRMVYYDQVKNFPLYEKATLEYMKNKENLDVKEYYSAAKSFEENATDPKSLNEALVWAEKAVMQKESIETYLLLAKLYKKNNKKEQAKMYAEFALQMAKKLQTDDKEIITLLEKL